MYKTLSSIVVDTLAIIGRVRFSFLMVLIGAVVLAVSAQGREAILMMAAAPWYMKTLFLVTALGWALSAWYCARVLCDRTFLREQQTKTPRWFAWLADHLPRLLGFLALFAVAIAFWMAGENLLGYIAMALGALFYAFALLRRRLLNDAGGPERTPAANLWELPREQKTAFFLMLACAFFVLILATARPVAVGRFMDAGTMLLLGFALIVPIGTLLILRGLASGFPVITTLLLASVLFSPFNDNHAIRLAEEPEGGITLTEVASAQDRSMVGFEADGGMILRVTRPTLRDLYDDWYDFSNCSEKPESDAPCPLVLVATAGGGSRAAYWTTTVLGTLTDIGNELYKSKKIEQPFDSSLFAVSGVSGGALGSVFYRALLTHAERAGNPRAIGGIENPSTGKACGSFKDCGQALAGGDFLAPILTSFLFPDLLQRFLPIAVFDDRATALEQGWETHWTAVMGRGALDFHDGFLSLWSAEYNGSLRAKYRFWPALYLNGTHVETSRRIITSNVDLGNSLVNPGLGGYRLVHADAFDLFDSSIQPCDIPMSTAANNSARFPYVDPAGRVRTGCTADNWGHIVDGGYFENFGAQTLLEILDALVIYSTVRPPEDSKRRRFAPIVVQISSDPGFAGNFTNVRHDEAASEAKQHFTRWANEVMSPPRTFAGLRGAQGRRAFADLKRGTYRAAEHLTIHQNRFAEYKQHVVEANRLQEQATKGEIPQGDVEDRSDRALEIAGEIAMLSRVGFAHFRMCPGPKRKEPALGWALSEEAQATIESYLPVDAVAEASDPMKLEAFCAKKLSGYGGTDSYGNECRNDNAAALQKVICGLAGLRERAIVPTRPTIESLRR